MNTEKLTEAFLIKMFESVGLNYTYEQILDYAKQTDWYTLQSWTSEMQDQFTAYMDTSLKKHTLWTKKTRQYEMAMFLLMWGWKVSD